MPVSPYAPRHAAVPVRGATAATGRTRDELADESVKAPGIAAMLRRSPHRVRQAAVAVIAAGLVLFVVTNVASAAPHRSSQPNRVSHQAAPAAVATSSAAPGPAPVVHRPRRAAAAPVHRHDHVAAKELAAKPVRSKQKAPATKQVISGLAANGIPNVALNAYRVAATRMRHDLPSCGIDWALLAGIGREESDHGRFGGAVLNRNGTSTPRIIGPALDGTHSRYIAAPANGAALDGDATYTHALGPMQFIPQTWARYGTDANGDGKADIFNINDAALSAARYLCAAGGDLRTQARQVRAVLAYNHSNQYLAQVLALAQAYRSGLEVTGIPVGILTGSLPPIKAGAPIAVNPGAPTAVGGSKHGSHGAKAGSGSGSHAPESSPGSKRPSAPKSSSPSSPKSKSSSPKSSSPKSSSPSSGSSSSPSGGKGGGGSGGKGGSSSPSPSPTPSPTCKVGIGGVCVVH
jgi:membrane-bound lytic murein transglycosylase B